MDAAAYLALLSKAKRVFESENTFLSFPVLSQLTYDVEDLQFSGDAPAAQRLVNLSEFSRVTNRIQRGVVAAIDGDEYLWDVYDDVLSNAELAEPALNEAQQKEYAAALELLYTETADGLRHESPVLQGYKTFRDAHIKALEEYKNRQLTADISADPAVKAQWVVDEAAIRQTIDDIEPPGRRRAARPRSRRPSRWSAPATMRRRHSGGTNGGRRSLLTSTWPPIRTRSGSPQQCSVRTMCSTRRTGSGSRIPATRSSPWARRPRRSFGRSWGKRTRRRISRASRSNTVRSPWTGRGSSGRCSTPGSGG